MGKRKTAKNSIVDVKTPEDEITHSISHKISKHVSFVGNLTAKMIGQSSDDHLSNSDYFLSPSGRGMRPSPSLATLNRLERRKIVIWRRPYTTIKCCIFEAGLMLVEFLENLWRHKLIVLVGAIVTALSYFGYHYPGAHQKTVDYLEKKLVWCLYWVGLGILSSIGFGTGLHTFLLYLGPHIASVTLAAYECESLKFPEPPYPDRIVCPSGDNSSHSVLDSLTQTTNITLWAIITKVRLEAFMWGAGTALGELPPYFMARAARLSGDEPDDEEYREFLAFVENGRPMEMSMVDKMKMGVEKFVERVGFPGILLCASVGQLNDLSIFLFYTPFYLLLWSLDITIEIPNPFFDLAGITCGHFLVPFWTFFGATLLGKAAIKMHIQMLFVVVALSEHHAEHVVGLLKYIPIIGWNLQTPFKEYIRRQKDNLHLNAGDPVLQTPNLVQEMLGWLVFLMVLYFLQSIINSLAQAYHKRLCQRNQETVDSKQK